MKKLQIYTCTHTFMYIKLFAPPLQNKTKSSWTGFINPQPPQVQQPEHFRTNQKLKQVIEGTTSLRSLWQCLSTLVVKAFFLKCRLKVPVAVLCHSCISSYQLSGRRNQHLFLHIPFLSGYSLIVLILCNNKCITFNLLELVA